MVALSPQLRKIILAFLLLTPWFSLYLKVIFPHLAQTGFDGSVITLVELVFVIFISIFGRHPKITKQGLFLLIAIAGWHLSGFISAYLSDHFYPSIIKQIEYLIHCMFAYSAWVFLSQTQKQEKMAWFLVFTFVWIVYYILCAWYINEDTYSFDWVHGTPLFNNIRHLGYLQIAILPFLLLPIIKGINHKYIITIILFSIFWSSVIWSGARSTFLVSILVSLLLIWFYHDKRQSITFIIILSSIIGWTIALQFPTDSQSMDPYRLLFLDPRVEQGDFNDASSGRLDIWMGLLTQVWQQNIWSGLGPDAYSFIQPLINNQVSQAHNTLIQLFSGIGIIGISFVLYGLYAIINTWRNTKASSVAIIARISLIGASLASMLDGHFYHTFSLVWLMIILALSFDLATDHQNNEKSSPILPALVIIMTAICIFNIQKHWNTYIQQQFPLEYQEQLDKVSNYPSYFRPLKWIYSEQTKPELREVAIKFGQKHGPRHCNYYLIEVMESKTQTSTDLNTGLLKSCSISELKATGNKKVLELINKDTK